MKVPERMNINSKLPCIIQLLGILVDYSYLNSHVCLSNGKNRKQDCLESTDLQQSPTNPY